MLGTRCSTDWNTLLVHIQGHLLSAENLFTVVKIFSQQFSVKTMCKPELRAMLSFRGKHRTQRLSSPWWQLGNRKCWLSEIMQPVERTLLIFDYYQYIVNEWRCEAVRFTMPWDHRNSMDCFVFFTRLFFDLHVLRRVFVKIISIRQKVAIGIVFSTRDLITYNKCKGCG